MPVARVMHPGRSPCEGHFRVTVTLFNFSTFETPLLHVSLQPLNRSHCNASSGDSLGSRYSVELGIMPDQRLKVMILSLNIVFFNGFLNDIFYTF